MEERLLAELDATEEVRQKGRSAVLRRALEHYLHRRRRASIAADYALAYGDERILGEAWEGWEEQGIWPAE